MTPMLENPFKVNEMLPAMTSDHDIEWLAAQLMPRVRGYVDTTIDGRVPLRVITYARFRVDTDGVVVITDESRPGHGKSPLCVYAVFQSSPGTTYEVSLKVCEDEDTAERLAVALRTLVYGRERLAGRMRSRDDV